VRPLSDLFYYLRWQTSVPTKLNEFAKRDKKAQTCLARRERFLVILN